MAPFPSLDATGRSELPSASSAATLQKQYRPDHFVSDLSQYHAKAAKHHKRWIPAVEAPPAFADTDFVPVFVVAAAAAVVVQHAAE